MVYLYFYLEGPWCDDWPLEIRRLRQIVKFTSSDKIAIQTEIKILPDLVNFVIAFFANVCETVC